MRKESGEISNYENIDREKFAKILKEKIKEKYISNKVFAERVGVTDQTVRRYQMRKTRSDCRVGTFEKKHGLPPGTIRNKDGRDTRSDKKIGTIRKEYSKGK